MSLVSSAHGTSDESLKIFPFSAVQGQERCKKALILAAINPKIGGVLLCSPAACGKSTLSRGLIDILPGTAQRNSDFVTASLTASEEMLLGTLDLDHVLNQQNVHFSPGLLSKAHGGVLYAEQVNQLPELLVAQLLNAAGSGVNRVERYGLSHAHLANFTLIATINPEQGPLSQQLLDRFGFVVHLDSSYSLAQRVEIIKTRRAFESDPGRFCEFYQMRQVELQQQISDARDLLHSVTFPDNILSDIAQRCDAAQVNGLCADLQFSQAAGAHAAWQGAQEVTAADIDAVEPFVLSHRKSGLCK
ncbi:ATP-binding protein [Psychromonas aquimarina]|uniref:ATP-binding protein n=1 Tax=Psychromonas aquimarina TaxID=444919 RepID=UPI00040A3804|nr:ATP-binding protein [Psychromonas aquimarina]